MRLLIKIFIFLLVPFGLFAQGESDWWYFGFYAGMHFSDDTVVSVNNSSISDGSYTNSISDEEGNLLFYTNGVTIYSSNHEQMESPYVLSGFNAVPNIAVKVGGNDSIYHLLSGSGSNLVSIDNSFTIAYRTVNINANNGQGIASDTIRLPGNDHEIIAATKHANGTDYWIVCRQRNGNTFISFALNSSGIDSDNPVYSYAGEANNTSDPNIQLKYLRFNPQGNLLAFSQSTLADDVNFINNGSVELFHFNKETGQVQERILKLDDTNVNTQDGYSFKPQSTEFSSNGEKMYVSGRTVFQCNLALLDSASIIQSMIRFNDHVPDFLIGGLQLAKDGRIYIANNGSNWLSVIHHPNVAGLGANFSFEGLNISPNNSYYFLPNLNSSLFSTGFTVSDRCVSSPTQFSLIYTMDYEYIHWDFGDGTTSVEWEPIHTYASPGSYLVELTSVVNSDTLIKLQEVIIEDIPLVDLGLDSSFVCDGESLLLDAYNYASYYTWQDSSYQSTFTVTNAGKYYVQVKNLCGIASDTIQIELDKVELDIGEDTLICNEETLLLVTNQSHASAWLWQDGSTLPYFQAESEGKYYVFVTTPCFLIYDSIYIYTEECGLNFPNIITPNGDGINDYFEFINLEMPHVKWSLTIYNRWGKQVYYSDDYQNDWNAENLSDGVYFYILRSAFTNTFYKGNITVISE